MDVNIQLIIVAIGLGLGYMYTKLPIRIVAVEQPKVSPPQHQWPEWTSNVSSCSDANRVFLAYVNQVIERPDLLGTLEWEHFFYAAVREKPDITWQELAGKAKKAAAPTH